MGTWLLFVPQDQLGQATLRQDDNWAPRFGPRQQRQSGVADPNDSAGPAMPRILAVEQHRRAGDACLSSWSGRRCRREEVIHTIVGPMTLLAARRASRLAAVRKLPAA